MNIRDAFAICNPLEPHYPSPSAMSDADRRAEWLDKRRDEVLSSQTEYANALELYLYQKPAEFAASIQKACSCSLGCSIALREMVSKAIDTYLDSEWAERDEVDF